MKTIFVPIAALLLASCSTQLLPDQAPIIDGAVSSAEPRATAAGEEMLAMGGSATDAALATLVALTVVEPQSSGIGGGGFLVRSDAQGNVITYDGRETAPSAADERWFLGEDGEPLDFRSVVPGGRSVGVPGNIAMIKLAHDRHGKLEWAELFKPAIRLARHGFPMTRRLHDMLARKSDAIMGPMGSIAAFSEAGRALYYRADGTPHPVGTMLTNPALAEFLERVAAEGPDAFYTGSNAARIAASVQQAAQAPAPMTVADIEAYEAKTRAPVCMDYRAHRVCSMGPPSSGATTMLQILGLLERFDLSALSPDDPAFWHLFTEASRLAYADREAYLGDADFVWVPVAGLLDDDYLAARSALISPDTVMAEVRPGTPPGAMAMADGDEPPESGTSHFAVADGQGNVVSLTSTIEGAFGSGLIVNGYYLNNELTDFSFSPTSDGKPVANAVAAGKRPRSSMTPSIVFAADGEPVLAVGAAGGSTIIVQTAKNIIAVIDWGMSAGDALAIRNVFAPGNVVMVEEGPGDAALIASLAAMGHENVRSVGPRFKANAVHKINGRWVPAFDPRTQKDVELP
ncbi:gamma-glutamyltransferase [Sphingomicrobium clamense]|uniref:Glutathione hydrolase proenzyme n=1 Tax=Sphingomicrobium clamense TaxID=2851013 RepID=A0ABS6V3H2_9SPHN|nr:gamma-glutamyltransferase [Sphingomicrobium sp. B8]MBW0144102.1 gamma-glutamyltransferase [Sphingomicrobium sp. B8]